MHVHVGFPQAIYLAIWLYTTASYSADVRQKEPKRKWLEYAVLLLVSFGMLGLLAWGGFFSG